MMCAPSKDSNQPAHSRSLIKVFIGAFWIGMNAKFLYAENEDADETARMRRLM